MIRRLFSLLLVALVAVGGVVASAPTAYATNGTLNPDTGTLDQSYTVTFTEASGRITQASGSAGSITRTTTYSGYTTPTPKNVGGNYVSSVTLGTNSSISGNVTFKGQVSIPRGSPLTLSFDWAILGSSSSPVLSLKSSSMSGGTLALYDINDSLITSVNVSASGSSASASVSESRLTADVSSIRLSFDFSFVSGGSYSGAVFPGVKNVHLTTSEFTDIGLLRSLLEWLKGIRDGIVNGVSTLVSALSSGFSSVVSGLGNIVNTLIELPGRLIELFITAMRNLFIPSDDDLSAIHSRFETVMSQKLGMLWELSDFFVSTLQGISGASQQSTITFPGLSLPLAGAVFTLPSYEVEIFPSAFSALQEPCKIMVTSVFFGAWIIGVQKFASKFLGEEEEP